MRSCVCGRACDVRPTCCRRCSVQKTVDEVVVNVYSPIFYYLICSRGAGKQNSMEETEDERNKCNGIDWPIDTIYSTSQRPGLVLIPSGRREKNYRNSGNEHVRRKGLPPRAAFGFCNINIVSVTHFSSDAHTGHIIHLLPRE